MATPLEISLDEKAAEVLHEIARLRGVEPGRVIADALALTRTIAREQSQGAEVRIVVRKGGKRAEVALP